MATRRLHQDLKKLVNDPPAGVSAAISDDGDIFKWDAMISGPGDTPFDGGTFRLRLEFPSNYPLQAPTVWFYSRMFHPNVYPNGKICLDILEEDSKWKQEYDGAAVLQAIQAMLGDPNPDSPANEEANKLFRENEEQYEIRVRHIVELSERDDGDESGRNLNAADEHDEIQARLEELDLSEFQGDPETIRQFLAGN